MTIKVYWPAVGVSKEDTNRDLEIFAWLEAIPRNDYDEKVWKYAGEVVYFEREEDAVMFKLTFHIPEVPRWPTDNVGSDMV